MLPAVITTVYAQVQTDAEQLFSLMWPMAISVSATFAIYRLFQRIVYKSTG